MRGALLAASESRWLREHGPRLWFVRRAVTRFMPGEQLADALAAAAALARLGVRALLTRLGENVTDRAAADATATHYTDALAEARRAGLDAQISLKLTQLGLDIDRELAWANLARVAEAAAADGTLVWIDMEQFPYVEATLALYERARAAFPNVGVCLQAYLYRTPEDLTRIAEAGGRVRLVKGAYRESPRVAFPRKRDVDRQYRELAERMIDAGARAAGFEAVFGTHDRQLIQHIQAHAAASGVPKDGLEFALLYGIQRGTQERLAREGWRVRVLISYGDSWFPWYMRRLAERPANVGFVLRSLVAR